MHLNLLYSRGSHSNHGLVHPWISRTGAELPLFVLCGQSFLLEYRGATEGLNTGHLGLQTAILPFFFFAWSWVKETCSTNDKHYNLGKLLKLSKTLSVTWGAQPVTEIQNLLLVWMEATKYSVCDFCECMLFAVVIDSLRYWPGLLLLQNHVKC
jgi:hypothetical protein